MLNVVMLFDLIFYRGPIYVSSITWEKYFTKKWIKYPILTISNLIVYNTILSNIIYSKSPINLLI